MATRQIVMVIDKARGSDDRNANAESVIEILLGRDFITDFIHHSPYWIADIRVVQVLLQYSAPAGSFEWRRPDAARTVS